MNKVKQMNQVIFEDMECNACGKCLVGKISTGEYKIRNNQLCCVECGTIKIRDDSETEYHTKLMLANLGIEKTLREVMIDYWNGIHDPRIGAYNRDVLNVYSLNPFTMGRFYY